MNEIRPTADDNFRCFLVTKSGKDQVESSLEQRPLRELPAGDILIGISHSSLNYKDALAATGHPGVVRDFPHVPGIDAAGTVVETASDQFQVGDEVLVTGYELGAGRWGGWADYIRVPADWVVPLPAQFSSIDAMAYGTAGFTAALCVDAILRQGTTPDSGEIVVTGATGGVGIIALKLLAKLGYEVVAVSGKSEKEDWLKSQGASRVISREEVVDESKKPLLSTTWAGAVDTVGGTTLSTIIRSAKIGACVSACGLVGGIELPLTVYPFILRGVTLAGIDSAWTPNEKRRLIWNRLAEEWRLDDLAELTTIVPLSKIQASVESMLAGQHSGRTVVEIQ